MEHLGASPGASLARALATHVDTVLPQAAPGPARRRISFAQGLTAVLALALLARVLVIVATPHFTPSNDAADYDRHAVSLAVHGTYPPSGFGGPSAFRPPAFPYLLAGVYKLVGVGSASRRWEAGRIAEALLGVLAVALVAFIAVRLWGPRVALGAAALAAVFPSLLLVNSSLMSEGLYIPLVLAAVLAALVHRDATRHRWRYAVLTGVLVGLAALTRSNGIFLLVPIVFLVWSERPRLSWSALRAPLLVAVVTGLTLVPWTVRNAAVFHRFIPISTESGYAFRGTYQAAARSDARYPGLWTPPFAEMIGIHAARPTLNEADISDRMQQRALDYIGAHPGYLFEVGFWNSVRLVNLSGPGLERYLAPFEGYGRGLAAASVYAFWLLGLLALVGLTTRAARRVPWAFWACPVVLAVPAILFLGATRYRSPADTFVIMLATLEVLQLLGTIPAVGNLYRRRVTAA